MKNIIIGLVCLISAFGAQSDTNPTCDEYSSYTCSKTSEFSTCDNTIIQKYTGNLYLPLNAHLRGIQIDENCASLAKSLIAAVSKLPQIKTKVFRGTKYREVLRTLKVGECYTDLGFTSTSKDLTTASYLFAPNPDYVLFEINAFSGRDITNHSQTKEEEVLLLPKTVLKLKAITSYNSKKLFKFSEVNLNQCEIVKH